MATRTALNDSKKYLETADELENVLKNSVQS